MYPTNVRVNGDLAPRIIPPCCPLWAGVTSRKKDHGRRMRFASRRRVARLWVASDARRFKAVRPQINTTLLDLNKTSPASPVVGGGRCRGVVVGPSGGSDRPSVPPYTRTPWLLPVRPAGILDAWVSHSGDIGEASSSLRVNCYSQRVTAVFLQPSAPSVRRTGH